MTTRVVTGIVLAGGRSARFGSDKMTAALDGRPVLHHAVEAVAQVTDVVLVVVAPGSLPPLPDDLDARIRIVSDPERFGGPLVALEAALAVAPPGRALVIAGDMPWLVPEVLRRLAGAIDADHAAAVLEVPGRVQPLPLALGVAAARSAARRVLEAGGRSLRDLLAELGAATLPASTWRTLDPKGGSIRDVDRPSDLPGRA